MIKSGFFYESLKGNQNATSYILTICSILIAYGFLGSIPLVLDLKFHGYSISNIGSTHEIISVLGKSRFLIHILFPFVLCFLFLWIGIRFLHKRTFLSVFTSLNHFRWKRAFTSFGLWILTMSIMLFLTVLYSDDIVVNFNLNKFIPLFFISIILIPIQTTTEEVLFRGYMAQAIHPRIRKGLFTILLTSSAFALMHCMNPEVEKLGYTLLLYYFITGLFLGLITLMDDGLELAIGYHAANNFFTAIMLTNNWQAFQTDAVFMDYSIPSFSWDAFITLLVIQPIFIFIFYKLYKWKNWKKRLFN